jgi:hypothetical protein
LWPYGVPEQVKPLIRVFDATVSSRRWLMPNLGNDTAVAAKMLIRRDVTLEDWSDPIANQYGVRATTRFGLGILRSNAMAKMTNIKITL